MRRLILTLCPAAMLAGLLLTSPLRAEDATVHGVFLSADTSKDVIDKAIDAVANKMNFLTGSVARSRLKKTNPLYQRIEIASDGAQISVKFDERQPIAMPADGSPIKWTRDDGEVFDVSARKTGSQLLQTFKAEDGERVNQFTPRPDGMLALDVTVNSPRLPAPVKYTLLYRRQ